MLCPCILRTTAGGGDKDHASGAASPGRCREPRHPHRARKPPPPSPHGCWGGGTSMVLRQGSGWRSAGPSPGSFLACPLPHAGEGINAAPAWGGAPAGHVPPAARERMNSPRENREVRLRDSAARRCAASPAPARPQPSPRDRDVHPPGGPEGRFLGAACGGWRSAGGKPSAWQALYEPPRSSSPRRRLWRSPGGESIRSRQVGARDPIRSTIGVVRIVRHGRASGSPASLLFSRLAVQAAFGLTHHS
jgi:hypothetical protein